MDTIIERFTIKKLHGERDVNITFDNNIKILVAENGYGKTTVLNVLYAMLSGEVSKLRKIDFESAQIKFKGHEEIKIKKSELSISIKDGSKFGIIDHIVRKLGPKTAEELLELAISQTSEDFKRLSVVRNASKAIDIPPSHLTMVIYDHIKNHDDLILSNNTRKNLNKIRAIFPYNIVYLPTYRRVEQDIRALNITTDKEFINEHAINFGMTDVKHRFEEITKEIISSSVEWFSKVNGQMLGQLVEGFKIDKEIEKSIDDPEAIKIVLDRIGSNLEEGYKKEIVRLIETKEIFENHEPLVYFISNLAKVYAQQKNNDKAIQDFSEVCNRYLVDKKIDYNESNVTIDIVRKKNGRSVDIDNLSSGEKQIISLFARLYLKKENNLAIFFDEPELSLSIEWQKTILPDIINSEKCAFMFATTHSPFIFENSLINNAVDLSSYIEEL